MDSFVTRPEPAAVHGGGVLNHAWFKDGRAEDEGEQRQAAAAV
jgi:hypothetical protein